MVKLFFNQFLLILFVYFSTATIVMAEDKTTVIKVGVYQLAPLVYFDDNGSSQGVFVDIIEEIARQESWKVAYVKGTWNDGLERVKKGQIDLMTGVMHLSRRESFLDFPEESVFNIWGQIYIHKDTDIFGVFDMEGKTIGLLEGGGTGENFIALLNKLGIQGKFVTFDSQKEVAQAVKEKRVDAGVFINVHGYNYQQSHQLKQTQIVFDPSYLKYAATEGRNQQLLSTIDLYLSKWKKNQNSPYYKIIEKHFGVSEIHKIPDWIRTMGIIGVSIIGLTIFAVFVLMGFNKKLKKEVKAATQDLLLELDRSKNTEKKLIKSEDRFRGIVYSMADWIWEVDCKGRYTYCSDKVESFLGYTPEQMLGKTPCDFMPPDEAKKIGKVFNKKVVQKKSIKNLENWNIHKNGQNVCLLTNGEPIIDKNGDLLGFRGVDKDITERKLADVALRKSEETHRKLVSNISDVIAVVDKDGIIRYKSSNVKRLFGWEPSELIGRHCLYTTHPDDKKRIGTLCADVFENGQKRIRVEYNYLCKDGSIRPIELTAFNLLNDPVIKGLLVNYKDISERKESEKILRESEEKYRTMIERSNDMVWTLDTAGNLTFFNEQTEKITGLRQSEWIGKSFIPLILEEELPMITEIFQKCLKGESQHYKFKFKKSDGSILTFSVNTAPLFKNGNVNGIVSFGRDITEQQKLEFQLAQAQKMQSIGVLAGGIAHDFNNILFPILGYSEMLLDDAPKDSTLKDGLNAIYTGAVRAKGLVQQILTFSRQEKRELVQMKMQPIIKEALKFIRSTIPTTINIKQDIQTDCGMIKADPTQIHQVIMNLTTNAYQAMKDTGGELKVSLKEIELSDYDLINCEMTPGNYLCLKVADTGIGMDKDLITKIFDPFFTTKEKGKGTGMGLSVVHGIVSNIAGTIKVFSEPGNGTEFNVYIPVEKSSSESQQRQIKQSIQGGTEQILLVDDEESIIKMEKQILERLGYKVTSHTSSMEALEAFRINPDKFDLIITDMAMPNLSGDKLAVELIKICPDIPILLCTGFSENIPQEKLVSVGIKDFLMKPISIKDLAQKVREVLDEKSS
jgi:PAS domain S-box-containing protein